MFFNEPLLKSKSLGKVWRVAHNVEMEDAEKNDLPKICDRLCQWIDTESVFAQCRMSLRTSSTFVNGAAKLYKTETERLLDDVRDLNDKMTRSTPRDSYSYGTGTDGKTSSDATSPECMRRRADVRLESSITPRRTRRQRNCSPILPRCSSSSSTGRSLRMSPERISVDDTNGPGNIAAPRKSFKDQGTQTSPGLYNEGIASDATQFRPDLPFGCLLIHDNYQSRMPSIVIVGNVNRDVTKLV